MLGLLRGFVEFLTGAEGLQLVKTSDWCFMLWSGCMLWSAFALLRGLKSETFISSIHSTKISFYSRVCLQLHIHFDGFNMSYHVVLWSSFVLWILLVSKFSCILWILLVSKFGTLFESLSLIQGPLNIQRQLLLHGEATPYKPSENIHRNSMEIPGKLNNGKHILGHDIT